MRYIELKLRAAQFCMLSLGQVGGQGRGVCEHKDQPRLINKGDLCEVFAAAVCLLIKDHNKLKSVKLKE